MWLIALAEKTIGIWQENSRLIEVTDAEKEREKQKKEKEKSSSSYAQTKGNKQKTKKCKLIFSIQQHQSQKLMYYQRQEANLNCTKWGR